MASRTIEIVLKATNAMAGGISSAFGSLKKFGQGVWDVGKKAAIALIGAGTAVTGLALKAVASYAEAEAASNALTSALRLNGEEADKTVEALKKRASAIQDETGVSDEATLQTMARLRMLGVETAALESAAKGVIALRSAGMDEAAATKAMAQARQGNFATLTRYLPALKNATSDAERAAVVNDFLTKGYGQQQDKLNTVSGAWGLLKERVGDVWEEIGAAIAQNDGLKQALQAAGEKVKEFGLRVAEWAGSGGVTKLIAGVLTFVEEARHGWEEVKLSFDVLSSWIADAWGTTANYISNLLGAIKNNWVVTFEYMRDMAVAVFEKIKHPFSEFKPPSVEPIKTAMKQYWGAIKGEGTKVTSAMDATNQRIEAEANRHAARLKEIEDNKNAKLNAPPPAPAAAEAVPPIIVAQENAEKARLEAEKKANAERIAMIDAEIAAREELLKKQQDLAAQTVKDYIAAAKAKEAVDKAAANDAEKADRLRAKQGRGAKLSKQDAEFLAAADAIKAAKNGIPKNEAALKALQNEKDKLQGRIADATEKMAAFLEKNLQFEGGG